MHFQVFLSKTMPSIDQPLIYITLGTCYHVQVFLRLYCTNIMFSTRVTKTTVPSVENTFVFLFSEEIRNETDHMVRRVNEFTIFAKTTTL